nr:galanin receptor 2a-like [Lytechinus pictus]
MRNSSTDSPEGPDEGVSDVVSKTIYGILGTVGIIGNGLVLVVMIGVRELRTITNLFIVNQSVIDMTTSILLLASYLAPRPSLPSPEWAAIFVCSVWNSGYVFWGTLISSTFNLVMVTIERYFAVVHPIRYRRMFSYRRAAAMVSIPWLLGFGYETYWAAVNRYSDGQCIIHYDSFFVQAFLGVFSCTIQFIIPLAIMAFVYINIAKVLRQRVEDIAPCPPATSSPNNHQQPTQQPNYRLKARKNVIKTLLVVSITYVICLTPNTITYLHFNLGGELDFDGQLFYFTVYLAFLNMCVNPFIYTFKYHKFQKGLRKLFRIKRGGSVDDPITATVISGGV